MLSENSVTYVSWFGHTWKCRCEKKRSGTIWVQSARPSAEGRESEKPRRVLPWSSSRWALPWARSRHRSRRRRMRAIFRRKTSGLSKVTLLYTVCAPRIRERRTWMARRTRRIAWSRPRMLTFRTASGALCIRCQATIAIASLDGRCGSVTADRASTRRCGRAHGTTARL